MRTLPGEDGLLGVLRSGKFEPFDVLDNGGNDTADFRPFSSDDIIEVTDNAFGDNLGIRVAIREGGNAGFVSILGHLENEENKVESFRFNDQTLTMQEIEALIEEQL